MKSSRVDDGLMAFRQTMGVAEYGRTGEGCFMDFSFEMAAFMADSFLFTYPLLSL